MRRWSVDDLPEKYQEQARQQLGQKQSKYKAQKTEYNGRRYDSKKEAARAAELDLLKEAGEVTMVLEQVPFRLPGNITYRLDFLVWWADGTQTFEDVKGYETPVFKMKKKLLEETYPVELTII